MDRLKDKIALVTGAGRGIGEGITKMFAHEGAMVALVDKAAENLHKVADEIEAAGGKAFPIEADITDNSAIERMVNATVGHFGGLDILINNAAIVMFTRSLEDELMETEYDRLMATNLKSVWMTLHHAIPHLRARGGGSIVNIASVHALASGGYMSAYAASKGALVAGANAIAMELAEDRIRVNCISPGTIWTNASGSMAKRQLSPEAYEEFMEIFGEEELKLRTMQQPLPIAGKPEDVAYCALYLASDEARFVTGSNFVVDGGMTACLSDPYYISPSVLEGLERRKVMQAWIASHRVSI